MARNMSGTNESIQNADGVSNIDVDVFTMYADAWVDVEPTSSESIFITASEITSGNSAGRIDATPPGTAGWRARFEYRFSSTLGRWIYQTDLSLSRWYKIAVRYSRVDTGENPRMWIDGAEVTMAETQTPVGTPRSGVDSIICGEDVSLGDDLDGRVANPSMWDAALATTHMAALTRGVNPFVMLNQSLQVHYPFHGLESPEGEYIQRANGTLNGTPDKAATNPPIELLENYL